MTLVVDGMPSSGGPRCFGCLGARGLASLASVEACWLASLVTSVSGSGSVTASSVSPVAWRQS